MRLPPFSLALVGMAGCILFVSSPNAGDYCHFRGEDTPCGACLLASCQSEVNAACKDESVLSMMEQCAAAGDEACGKIPNSDVATCLKAHCPALCYARVGTSQTDCTDSFVSPGLACSCQVDNSPNDLLCAEAVYVRARGCAPSGWPGPALQCVCKAVACFPLSDGCNCVLTDNLDTSTAEECRGQHCCAIQDRCQCRTRPCEGGEREVAECNKAEVACPQGNVEFPSCAIRQ
jgi:hypothetical protein